MKLIVILGAGTVGKMTVGQELAVSLIEYDNCFLKSLPKPTS